MAKLRLINPSSPISKQRDPNPLQVEVAVDVPVPHLEGEYTYLAPEGSVRLGSLVKVPFSQGETFGFVTHVAQAKSTDFKWITEVIALGPLFDEESLLRYRRIATEYGSSLISILKLGIPIRKGIKVRDDVRDVSLRSEPSAADGRYLASLFGARWNQGRRINLLLPPAVLWDRVAVSLFLANPAKTIIMVPTERDLQELMFSLEQREIMGFVTVTSTQRASERSRQFLELGNPNTRLVIGTRAVTFAPFSPETTIIVDPGHEGYQERRSPYSRSDDPQIWEGKVVTINHSRQMSVLAQEDRYLTSQETRPISVSPTSSETIIDDLRRELRSAPQGAAVLISINDSSFASGLRCAFCRNSSRCECGFPLRIPSRGADAACSKCQRSYPKYVCAHCGRHELTSTRSGSRSWALTLARSVKGSRVVLSESSTFKSSIDRSPSEITFVVAQHGFEPRVRSTEGKADGYDVIVLLGGRSGFNSETLTKNDRFRMRWARIRGLARESKPSFLLDIDREHPEFVEFRAPLNGKGLEVLLLERRLLHLPPYSILVELKGSDSSLHQLRKTLENDELFKRESNVIFPVHDERLVVKVDIEDRHELLRLLQAMVRVRSSKRLAPIHYVLSPLHL